MDIRAIASALASTSGSVSAFDTSSVPADSRSLIADISSSTSLSDTAKTGLIQAVAMADSGLSSSLRSEAMAAVGGLGLYFRSTSSDGWPRWEVMTGLKVYGLNITEHAAQPVAETLAPINQHLDNLARSQRGVSLEHAQAVVKQVAAAAPQPVAPPTPAPVAKPVAPRQAPSASPQAPAASPGHVVSKVV